jgi:hypothetical protein
MDDDKKQIVVALSGPDPITDLNSKNILAIINMFPTMRYEWSFNRGSMNRPKGKLIFEVPREKPEQKLSEWEISWLSTLTIGAEADTGYGPLTNPALPPTK